MIPRSRRVSFTSAVLVSTLGMLFACCEAPKGSTPVEPLVLLDSIVLQEPDSALIGEAAGIEHLQEEIEDGRMRLLELASKTAGRHWLVSAPMKP